MTSSKGKRRANGTADEIVVSYGSEIAYLHDRSRIFEPDGTVHDIIGGQRHANWSL